MNDMTPQQAADEVERVMARTMPLRNHEHLRVLIDHARNVEAKRHVTRRGDRR